MGNHTKIRFNAAENVDRAQKLSVCRQIDPLFYTTICPRTSAAHMETQYLYIRPLKSSTKTPYQENRQNASPKNIIKYVLH